VWAITLATRCSTTISSKVNLLHVINLRAWCVANSVTLPSRFEGNETLELHRVDGDTVACSIQTRGVDDHADQHRPVLRPCRPVLVYLQDSFRKIRALTPLTPNTVELMPTVGALFPRGGPVQDPVLTPVPPRQRAESGGSFLKRLCERNWLLKTSAMHGESTFGNPFNLRTTTSQKCEAAPRRARI